MPQLVEVTRLLAAIEAFQGRAPRDLPDGVMDGLQDISKQLSTIDPQRSSPGSAEAQKVAAGATGEHFSKAAKGPDKPSPGQREAESVTEAIKKVAGEAMEKVGGNSR